MDLIGSEFFTGDSYEVYCLLQKANPNLKFHGTADIDGMVVPPDIYAPDGIKSLELDGKTLVEVKRNMNYSALMGLESMYATYGDEYNVLFVYYDSSLSNVPELKRTKNKDIKLISIKDLKKGKRNTSVSPNSLFVDKNRQRSWQKYREKIIKEAQGVVDQGNNVLFLGAGVSTSAGMPKWTALLQSLMGEVTILNDETRKAFKQLDTHVYEECGDSNLVMARYLQTAIKQSGSKEKFENIIQRHLYSEDHTSPLLKNIANVIKQKKTSEVITYNFDDILEQELAKEGLVDSKDFTTIAKDAEVYGHNTLPIYHVHGIIPEHQPAETVVFSEEEYHKRYKDVYHWSNVEQLHALSRMHCFFIGLSMTDPNLRRLLDISRRINTTDTINHYAFLKRTKLDEYCLADMQKACKYMQVSESLIDKKKQQEIYGLNYGVIESIYYDLGVKVIWFEDFNDLPNLIADVFKLNEFKQQTTDEIKSNITDTINLIQEIENKAPKFNAANLRVTDVVKYLNYKKSYGKQYRELISKGKEMLDELTSRITIDKPQDVLELQSSINIQKDSISGFAGLYRMWYDCIKNLVK